MVSPTQIALYLRDPRAWRAAYIDRQRPRPHLGDFIGADVHRLLAAYLRNESEIAPPGPASSRWGRSWHPHAIAAAGLAHLPPPGSVQVEVRRVLELAGGARVVCRKDAERDGLPELDGLIIDHKTAEDPDRAAVAELASDVQAAIYATEHLARTGRRRVELRWIWYAIDGSGSRLVDQVVGPEDLSDTLALVEQAIRDMEAELCRSLICSRRSTASAAPARSRPSRPSQEILPHT